MTKGIRPLPIAPTGLNYMAVFTSDVGKIFVLLGTSFGNKLVGRIIAYEELGMFEGSVSIYYEITLMDVNVHGV